MTPDATTSTPPTEAVSLTLPQVFLLAEHHQHQALAATTPEDMAFHQREAGRLVDVAVRLNLAAILPGPSQDPAEDLVAAYASPGEPEAPAVPASPVSARITSLSSDEFLHLAVGYADLARAEQEAGHHEASLAAATRGLELRQAALSADPVLAGFGAWVALLSRGETWSGGTEGTA